MAISADYTGATFTFGIGDFSGGTYSNQGSFNFIHTDGDTIASSTFVFEDPPHIPVANTFFTLPFVFGGGQGNDIWKFAIDANFFAAYVGATIAFQVILQATSASGQPDGEFSFLVTEKLQPFDPNNIETDHYGITRTTFTVGGDAKAIAHAIDISATTEVAYVNGLLQSVADTTIPAVAVEGSMYEHVGSHDEIDNLVNNFLPAQVSTALNNGLNAQVYACEVLGLAFATADENGGTAFAASYGPSNQSTPNTPDGDAAFAEAASMKIFGAAANANTPDAIAGFVANWKAFYTDNGIPGILNPTPDQVDLYARGAAWGDAVGVALANNLGQLPQATINFLEDAAQGRTIYGASLLAQPTPLPFEGETSSASGASQVQLTGVGAPVDHMLI